MFEASSATGAESQYYGAFMKSESLSKVPDLYKNITQTAPNEKKILTAPFGSEAAVFDKNMDVLDISQQAYLLKTGYQQPEKEKESITSILKSEKKENSPLTYTPATLTRKKENTTVLGTLLNTQNTTANTGTLNQTATGTKTAAWSGGINTQTQTGIKFDALF